MKKVVFVICGGPMGDPAFLKAEMDRHLPVCTICADGGARYLHMLGLKPELIIGDMDSLESELQGDFVRQGSRIIRYPQAKDETDSQLAVEMALMMNPAEIRIYGAIGARIDHTLANLMLLSAATDCSVEARLIDQWCEIFLVRKAAVIAGEIGQTVSLFAFGLDVTGVTLEGFEYPLQNATIDRNKPIGVSNRLVADRGTITVHSGDLLVIRYFSVGKFPQGA